MTRYDIYDNELHPGDVIIFIKDFQIESARIQSITLKGTIKVWFYNPAIRQYSGKVRCLKTVKIIKPTGLPV